MQHKGKRVKKRENNKQLGKLFYNPKSDSVEELLELIRGVHKRIEAKTDTSKATLPMEYDSYLHLVENSQVPQKSLGRNGAYKLIAEMFDGVVRWHSPRTMYNLTPPPLLHTVAATSLAMLYNPNIVWDVPAGKMALAEQRVIKEVAEYTGWDWKIAGGTFTFGGKGTDLYAIKVGLRKSLKDSSSEGVKQDVVVFSTKACHPCHIQDADWLGIGTKNVIRINTNNDSTVNLTELATELSSAVVRGKRIASILISGGTTNNMAVDPIKEIVKVRNDFVDAHKLDYTPHLHVDSVVGWPWLFFKDYNKSENPLRISKSIMYKIDSITNNLKDLYMADSFGVDFHKMGFCPYNSSLFMLRDKKDLYSDKDNFVNYGQYTPFAYTLENSRGATGALNAYIALNLLGIEGFQKVLTKLMNVSEKLHEMLRKSDKFEVVSKTSLGNAVVFVPKLPQALNFANQQYEANVRNAYTLEFLTYLRKIGNPFLIDSTPAYSTGSDVYPYRSLKACIMSPFADDKNSKNFVSLLSGIKDEIDKYFDFADGRVREHEVRYMHPLKETRS